MPALAWVGKRSVSWTNGQIGELLVQLSLIERRQGRTAAACVGSKLNGRGQLMMITVQHHHPYTTDVIALHGVGDAEWAGRFPSPSLGLLPLHGQYHPPGIGPTPDNLPPQRNATWVQIIAIIRACFTKKFCVQFNGANIFLKESRDR